MPENNAPQSTRRPPATALALLALGLVLAGIELARHHADDAVSDLAVMVAAAAVLTFFRSHHDGVALLATESGDERVRSIQTRAGNVTTAVMAPVLVTGWLVQTARGAADASTWGALCAVCGGTMIVSTLVLDRRS
jgi:hypothetical protein